MIWKAPHCKLTPLDKDKNEGNIHKDGGLK